MSAPWLVALMGPTGSGKSAVAEALAERLGAQLVNADAFQVYRGFDIGTNKPENRPAYKLLDLKDPHEWYGVGEFVLDALTALLECWERGQSVVLVGGTGLYIRALMEEYADLGTAPDPALREQVQQWRAAEGIEGLQRRLLDANPNADVDWQNPLRVSRALERALAPSQPITLTLPEFQKLKLGLSISLEALEPKLAARVNQMMERGWREEVERHLANGVAKDAPAMRAIGYIPLVECILGHAEWPETMHNITLETRQYAKRQNTWLRSEPNLVRIGAEQTLEEIERHCVEVLLAKGALI